MELEKLGMFAGMALLVIASGLLFVFDRPELVSIGIYVVGLALLMLSLYKYISCGKKFDERVHRITTVSMAYSWITILAFIASMLVMDLLGLNRDMSAIRILSWITFMMMLFYGTWYGIYSLKGDVD